MKKTLFVALGAVLLLGVGFGVGAGWSVATWTKPLESRVFEQQREALQQDAYLRYRLADYDTAKCSLLDYVSFTRDSHAFLSVQGQRLADQSVGLSFARIAVAAGRAKREKEQEEYFRYAQAALAKLGEHPTNRQLVEQVEAIDREWDVSVRSRKPLGTRVE